MTNYLNCRSVCRASLAAAGLLSCSRAIAEVQDSNDTATWQAAVVCKVRNGHRSFVGIVYSPSLNSAAQRVAGEGILSSTASQTLSRPGGSDDYEIWLESNGRRSAVVLSALRQAVWPATRATEDEDHGTAYRSFARIVKEARADTSVTREPTEANGSYPTGPRFLWQACRESDAIVVGRVIGTLRDAPTPRNAPRSPMRHTVVLVFIEQHLKGSSSGPILKVLQVGGKAPGSRLPSPGDPLLHVSARYILFLKLPTLQDPSRRFEHLGFVAATVDGVTGPGSELDEFILLHPWYGQVYLSHGRTETPPTPGLESHWKYAEDPQIIDVDEVQAINAILTQAHRGAKLPKRNRTQQPTTVGEL
jgi:hypothetical protein